MRPAVEPEPEPRSGAGAPGPRPSIGREVADGLRHVLATPVLRRVLLAWTLYGALGSGLVIGLVTVGTGAGATGPALASVAVAAYAGGSLLGTLAAGRRGEASPWRAIALSLVAVAAGAALVATVRPPGVVAGALVFGAGEGWFLIVYLAVRARATPAAMLGRVTALSALLAEARASAGRHEQVRAPGAGARPRRRIPGRTLLPLQAPASGEPPTPAVGRHLAPAPAAQIGGHLSRA